MELAGTRFVFDVPAGWRAQPRDPDRDVVVATAGESLTGPAPQAVLREWRLKSSSWHTLANVSQVSITELAQTGAVLHVEAIPDERAEPVIGERRRLWAFSAPKMPGTDDSAGLLIIRDLLVTGKAAAKLTVTTPLAT